MNYYVKLKICNLKCNLEATKVANVIFVYFRCLRTQAIQLKIRGDHLGCRGPGAYGIPSVESSTHGGTCRFCQSTVTVITTFISFTFICVLHAPSSLFHSRGHCSNSETMVVTGDIHACETQYDIHNWLWKTRQSSAVIPSHSLNQ